MVRVQPLLPLNHSCTAKLNHIPERGTGLTRPPGDLLANTEFAISADPGQAAPEEDWDCQGRRFLFVQMTSDDFYGVCVCRIMRYHQQAQVLTTLTGNGHEMAASDFLRKEVRIRENVAPQGQHSACQPREVLCVSGQLSQGFVSFLEMCFSHFPAKRHYHQKVLQRGHLDTWFLNKRKPEKSAYWWDIWMPLWSLGKDSQQ